MKIFNKYPTCKQFDLMDCGPACLKIIARYHGRHYSLKSLREKCHITR